MKLKIGIIIGLQIMFCLGRCNARQPRYLEESLYSLANMDFGTHIAISCIQTLGITAIAQVTGEPESEDFPGRYPWPGFGGVSKIPPTEDLINKKITGIAREISGENPAVMGAIQDCVSDIKAYCREHSEQYKDRNADLASGELMILKWLGMTDILIRHGYAWELDWRCELEDFEFALQEILKKNEDAGCPLKALGDETLSEDDNITVWCTRFSKACPLSAVGCIDIDSDSYVIFPTQKTVLDRFWQAAAQIGQKVAPVENS